MKKLILLLVLVSGLFAWDVVPKVGMAMNGNLKGSVSGSYVHSESPLGVFGICVEETFGEVTGDVCYRHVSSIPQMDETQGINELIGTVEYSDVYVGVTYTTEDWTSAYYTEQFGTKGLIVGVRHEFEGGRELYAEYIDSLEAGKKDRVMVGFNLRFETSK